MKRISMFALAFTALFWLNSFSAYALPEGAIARLGIGMVEHIAFSPDGDILAVASSTGTNLYDPVTLAEIGSIKSMEKSYSKEIEVQITSVVFSPDGKLLVSQRSGSAVRLWDVPSWSEVATLKYASGRLSFSPDGKLLASGDDDNMVKLWDVASRMEIAKLRGSWCPAESLSFSPDGSLLAIGGTVVGLLDVASRSELATIVEASGPVSFSPDGSLLASEGWNSRVVLWAM